MFGKKVKGGVDVTRESWRVLRSDPELLLFPICSALAAIALLATIISAGVLMPHFGKWVLEILNTKQPHTPAERAIGLVILFLVYFVEYFVIVFFNTALVGCALLRFDGGAGTVKQGFHIAVGRLPQIFAWSLFAAAVGTVLSAIEQRLGWVGQWIVRFIGLAWAVATYFVVPVLAAEGAGPVEAVRRSVDLLKKNWGEGLAGNFVISAATWIVMLPLIAFGVIGFVLAATYSSIAIGVVTGVILAFGVLLLAVVTSALRQIFLAGLYRYAMTGQAPTGFSQATLQQALLQK